MVAVFPNRSPSCKERPYRTEVISAAVIKRRLAGNDAHAPISLVLGLCELMNRGFALVCIDQAKPHRHRGQHRKFIDATILLIQREAEKFLIGGPERLVEHWFLPIERRLEIPTDVRLSNNSRKTG